MESLNDPIDYWEDFAIKAAAEKLIVSAQNNLYNLCNCENKNSNDIKSSKKTYNNNASNSFNINRNYFYSNPNKRSNINYADCLPGACTLARRINIEIKVIKKALLQHTRRAPKLEVINSSNLHQLGAVAQLVAALQAQGQVVGVLQKFRDDDGKQVSVDVVADRGRCWLKVVCRCPDALQLAHVTGGGRGGAHKAPLRQMAQLHQLASRHPIMFTPPKVCAVFWRGVSHRLAVALTAQGTCVATACLIPDHMLPASRQGMNAAESEDWEDLEEEVEIEEQIPLMGMREGHLLNCEEERKGTDKELCLREEENEVQFVKCWEEERVKEEKEGENKDLQIDEVDEEEKPQNIVQNKHKEGTDVVEEKCEDTQETRKKHWPVCNSEEIGLIVTQIISFFSSSTTENTVNDNFIDNFPHYLTTTMRPSFQQTRTETESEGETIALSTETYDMKTPSCSNNCSSGCKTMNGNSEGSGSVTESTNLQQTIRDLPCISDGIYTSTDLSHITTSHSRPSRDLQRIATDILHNTIDIQHTSIVAPNCDIHSLINNAQLSSNNAHQLLPHELLLTCSNDGHVSCNDVQLSPLNIQYNIQLASSVILLPDNTGSLSNNGILTQNDDPNNCLELKNHKLQLNIAQMNISNLILDPANITSPTSVSSPLTATLPSSPATLFPPLSSNATFKSASINASLPTTVVPSHSTNITLNSPSTNTLLSPSIASLPLLPTPTIGSSPNTTSLHFPAPSAGIQRRVVNLDVPCLVAYISNTSNGSCGFVFEDAVLTQQAQWEAAQPVKPIIEAYWEGAAVVVCREAVRRFEAIVAVVAGAAERQRAHHLLNTMVVQVPDDDDLRDVVEVRGGVTASARIVFGSARRYRAATITANTRLLRAARAQGVRLEALLHGPRALTEQKQATATQVTPSPGVLQYDAPSYAC